MIKWSYSGLKQYVNCPKQFNEVRVLQKYKQEDTKYTLYGKEVHKALEDYARDKKPLGRNHKQFQSVVDVLLDIPGEKYVEYQMALRIDHTPCSFDAPDYWVRGIADLMIVDGDTAFVIDYKTGNNKYADPKQLKLMALMTFAHFPDVETVKGGLLFVVKNSFLPDEYVRSKQDKYWRDFAGDLQRMEMSYDTGKWLPNPSGLCRYCPVTTCEFHKD
jgi:CRISPR/Cas system-associated exonuclease Cas4 (RecB family)